MKVYQKLSVLLGAIANCENHLNTCSSNTELNCGKCNNSIQWIDNHQNSIDTILSDFPSGSGFDAGTNLEQLEQPVSTPEKLVFNTSYHHLNENGFYTGWTNHNVIVTPSLQFGYNIKVTGKNINGIKEYVTECFANCLDSEVTK
jgi:hypothetical protein